MKRYKKIGLLLLAVIFGACSDWLDLTPETDPTEKQIYSQGEGYRSVLNGLYQNMGKVELYGRDLSFGFVDCLSQQYDINEDNNKTELWQEVGKMNYRHNKVSPVIEETWLAAYNVIANANNLIQNILQKSTPDLFEEGELERNMILGEAYACRALMHFDMLRLFAPAKTQDDGKNYIPYVEEYPSILSNGISVDACLEKVIADLNRAKDLCMAFDTSALAMNAMCEGNARFYNEFNRWTDLGSTPGLLKDFFKGRGYRLNYYSITALLARVYQYADRHKEAFDCADEVMKFTYKASKYDIFPFFTFSSTGIYAGSDNSTSAFEAKSDLRMVNNLIFAVYNEKAYDRLSLGQYFAKELKGAGAQYFVVKRDEIFKTEDGSDEKDTDVRAKKLIYMADSKYPVSGKWFWHADEAKREKNVTILPVLRATEMQYIMAEYYARQQQWTEAAALLNNIRSERDCFNEVNFSSWADFVKCLVNDARREWVSEGQLFYLYKRLGTDVNFGDGVKHPYSREEFLVPIPASQSL